MSDRKTSRDIPSATSSPASAGGRKPSGLPVGHQGNLFGQAHARANPFRWQGLEKAMQTKGISGRSSAASSWSARLQLSLESRLQVNLAESGSPEYVLTWKRWDMESGPPICALRASARRTSGSGSSGWSTATVNDASGSEYAYSRGDHGKPVLKLPGAVKLAGSLAKTDDKGGYRLNPHFSRWLMGFPAKWLSSKVLATLSSRRSRRNS